MACARMADQDGFILDEVVVLGDGLAGVDAVGVVEAFADCVALCYADAHLVFCEVEVFEMEVYCGGGCEIVSEEEVVVKICIEGGS